MIPTTPQILMESRILSRYEKSKSSVGFYDTNKISIISFIEGKSCSYIECDFSVKKIQDKSIIMGSNISYWGCKSFIRTNI